MNENYIILFLGIFIFFGTYFTKDNWYKRIMIVGSGILIGEGIIFLIL